MEIPESYKNFYKRNNASKLLPKIDRVAEGVKWLACRFTKKLTKDEIKAYTTDLARHDFKIVTEAIQIAAEEATYFPPMSKLTEIIKRLKKRNMGQSDDTECDECHSVGVVYHGPDAFRCECSNGTKKYSGIPTYKEALRF
jgi:hypothetical protein